MVGQFTAHAAGAGILLHALQAVEHDQVRTAVTQAPLQPFEAPAGRPVVLAEKELVALAQERVGLWPLVERPDEHVRLAGLHLAHDPLHDGRLAGAAGRDQRPHAIGRRGIGDPVRQLLDQCVTAVEVRRGLERMDDADLALLRRWRLLAAFAAREWLDSATAIFRPRSSGVVNVSQTNVARSHALNAKAPARPRRPPPRAQGPPAPWGR